MVGLQGNGGSDELRLAADTYDLTGKFISGFETITLLGSASVRFADKATALLAHSQTRAGTLTLTGGSFSGAELGTLFTQGLISITDGNGTHVYVSPTVQATLAPVSLPMTEAATPFANAVVAGSPGMILAATVTMSAPDQGRFVAAKGEYNPRTGVYTVTGTAAEVQAALRALAFDPRDRAAVINSSEKTTLSLVVGDAIQSTGPLVAVVDSIATNVAPGVPVLSHAYIQENAKAGEVVGDVTAIDPNPGDPLTIELVDNAGGRFVLGSDGKLRVASGAVLDHETGASHRIAIRVADAGKLVAEKTFTIRVDDIPIEEMSGTSRSDVLVGGSGKDKLYGKLGNDKLTGGLGQDIFVFDTKPSKKANLDKLVDFSVKDVAIWLDNAVFTKLGKAGSAAAPAALKSGLFATAKAKDKNDHVIYDKAKGVLLYNADGSGKGKAVEIATLAKGLALKASDFFVV